MKRPTQEQIDTAILWLQTNDGRDGESVACNTVAQWLDHLMREAAVKSLARKVGVTPARMRRKLAEAKGKLAEINSH